MEPVGEIRPRWGGLRSVLTAVVLAALTLALSSCIADHAPVGDIAIQRAGDGLRIAFCDGAKIDVLWVDQRDDRGRSHIVWEARPYLTLGSGEVVDGARLGDSLVESGAFDFDSGLALRVQASGADSSVEADFPTDVGVPARGWLKPDGQITDSACD